MAKHSFYRNCGKRFLDIFLSLCALIVFGIPLLIVALFVKVDIGSPVLFRQKRIGLNNKEFSLLKFRSMRELRDENGVYLPDEERITKLGNIIRKTSVDELPSLINILKGDMSIIGPRPLPSRYLDRYTEEQKHRHDVRPGLSCPSTAAGRNCQTWERQFEGDLWYVQNVSLAVDIKCIFHTVKIVLTHEGATTDDGARGEFIGTADKDQLLADSEGNYMKL